MGPSYASINLNPPGRACGASGEPKQAGRSKKPSFAFIGAIYLNMNDCQHLCYG
jgi:hypothetical protein